MTNPPNPTYPKDCKHPELTYYRRGGYDTYKCVDCGQTFDQEDMDVLAAFGHHPKVKDV